MQIIKLVFRKIPVYRSEHTPDQCISFIEVFLHSSNGIIGKRLNHFRVLSTVTDMGNSSPVKLSSNPTDQPSFVFPVILAAPNIFVNSGASIYSSSLISGL